MSPQPHIGLVPGAGLHPGPGAGVSDTPIHEAERTRNEDPGQALAQFRQNMSQLGFGLPGPSGQAAVSNPSLGGMLDWFDFPTVVAAYAHSFPHHGPMNRRSQDWEDQTYPSSKPQLKRPKGPGESVIMS